MIENANVELIDIDCDRFYENYNDEKPSMVLIDASHKYENVSKDIRWAIDMEIPIIVGHDYSEKFSGVTRAVDEYFADRTVEVVDSLWAVTSPAFSHNLRVSVTDPIRVSAVS